MTFGQRLKRLRVESGLTQEELGKKIKLSKSNISKYESGDVEPNMQTIIEISRLFKCSTDFLLGATDDPGEKAKENELTFDIERLSIESKEELQKYVHLLKMKDQMDKSKEEQSCASEKKA